MIPIVVVFFCGIFFAGAAPLPRRMVDLTYNFNEKAHHYPLFKDFNMTVVFNGTFMDTTWLQHDEYTSTTHAGTHMDAPSHFIAGGLNIEQIDIENFIAPAAVIDITQRAEQDPNAAVTVDDLLHWEEITGHSLDGSIVLMRSGYGKHYYNRTAYIGNPVLGDHQNMHFPGFEGEAADWLVENRKIKGVGVDTISFDRGDSSTFPAHKKLLGSGIYGLENVANLEQIPIYGATLYVMPMKIERASGAPTRVIATYPEVIFTTPHN